MARLASQRHCDATTTPPCAVCRPHDRAPITRSAVARLPPWAERVSQKIQNRWSLEKQLLRVPHNASRTLVCQDARLRDVSNLRTLGTPRAQLDDAQGTAGRRANAVCCFRSGNPGSRPRVGLPADLHRATLARAQGSLRLDVQGTDRVKTSWRFGTRALHTPAPLSLARVAGVEEEKKAVFPIPNESIQQEWCGVIWIHLPWQLPVAPSRKTPRASCAPARCDPPPPHSPNAHRVRASKTNGNHDPNPLSDGPRPRGLWGASPPRAAREENRWSMDLDTKIPWYCTRPVARDERRGS